MFIVPKPFFGSHCDHKPLFCKLLKINGGFGGLWKARTHPNARPSSVRSGMLEPDTVQGLILAMPLLTELGLTSGVNYKYGAPNGAFGLPAGASSHWLTLQTVLR